MIRRPPRSTLFPYRRSSDLRVLELPGADFSHYRWGATLDPVPPGLMDRSFVSRELIPYGEPASAALLMRSEEHTSELQSQSNLVCRLLLEKKTTRSPIPAPPSPASPSTGRQHTVHGRAAISDRRSSRSGCPAQYRRTTVRRDLSLPLRRPT